MRCRSVLTRVDALRTGELVTPEVGKVKEHLRICPSCDESVADVDRLAEMVKSIAAAPPRSCCETLSRETSDSFDRVQTPEQTLWVAFTERGLRMITPAGSLEQFRRMYAKRYGRGLTLEHIPDALRKQVLAAVSGEGVSRPQLDVAEATELEEKVLGLMTRIPRGEVRTYAWLAHQAGRPRAVRAVANVVARNAVPFVVPCHRVVPSAGGTGNYAFGSERKRSLLKREGVDVGELDALARERTRFIGSQTTHIFCFPTCRDARRIRDANRVPFRGAGEALEKGYRPCQRCKPAAA
jgi:methylated-DNA-[protein]-cysteine S-methyltransferase